MYEYLFFTLDPLIVIRFPRRSVVIESWLSTSSIGWHGFDSWSVLNKFSLSWVLQGHPKFPPTHPTKIQTPWLLKTDCKTWPHKVSRRGTSSAHLFLWYGRVYWTKTHPSTLPEEKSEITRDETNNRREVLKISARLKGSKGAREGCMSWRGLFTSVKTVRKAATWSVCGVPGRRRRRGLWGGGR